MLRQSLGLAHISTGDMLRERIAAGDDLGKAVTDIMQSGGLVPDEMVNKMVEERIAQPDTGRGFILDGYPRTVGQANLLDSLLRVKNIRAVVVHLKVDYNVIIARLSGRRLCPSCGALYSVSSNKLVASEFCDRCGSPLVVRDDDREEVVVQRMKTYDLQTTPVLEFLQVAGYPCHDVQGEGRAPQVIEKEIEAIIEGDFVKARQA